MILERLKKYARISLWDIINRSDGNDHWIKPTHLEKVAVDSITILGVDDIIAIGVEVGWLDNRPFHEDELGPFVNKVYSNLKNDIFQYLKTEFYLYIEGVSSLSDLGRD